MKPEQPNIPANKPDNRQSAIQERRPKSICIKIRNAVVAIVLFCLLGIIFNLTKEGMNKLCDPMIDFILEKTGIKDSPWLPGIALVVLIVFCLGTLWIVFNYLRKEAKRDRAGHGLSCSNCGQPIHFRTFRLVNSCPHCGHQI